MNRLAECFGFTHGACPSGTEWQCHVRQRRARACFLSCACLAVVWRTLERCGRQQTRIGRPGDVRLLGAVILDLTCVCMRARAPAGACLRAARVLLVLDPLCWAADPNFCADHDLKEPSSFEVREARAGLRFKITSGAVQWFWSCNAGSVS